MNRKGAASIVWMLDTGSRNILNHRYFVDQKTLQIVWDYPLQMNRIMTR